MNSKKSFKVVVSSPSLRARGLEVARGFTAIGSLVEFVTTIGLNKKGPLYRTLNKFPGVGKELKRRLVPDDLTSYVHNYALPEILRVATHRLTRSEQLTHKVWWWSERCYDKHVARRWAGKVDCIYGFELSSLETFRAQKAAGKLCILSQPIAHFSTLERVFQQELMRHPEWATAYDESILSDIAEVNAIKEEELQLADLVIAQSEFVAESLRNAGISDKKIVAIPTAAPPVVRAPKVFSDRVILLSAGSQSLRKGTHYIIEAWKQMRTHEGFELWLVGNSTLPESLLKDLPGKVWRSQSVNKEELYDIYQKASVLVLPTLAEGLAYVLLEAISCGLPIITTPNSGCGSFVQNGVNGWVIPPADANALREKIEWCSKNPLLLSKMGNESKRIAAEWTFDDFVEAHNSHISSLF